jgi:hypothetical protein
MLEIVLGLFIIAHGAIHGIYLGHSQRWFEMVEGMTWPDESWAFRGRLPVERIRLLASVGMGLAAAGFAIGGLGVLLDGDWARALVVVMAVFSALVYGLLWDGRLAKPGKMGDQGWYGVLIDVGLVVSVFVL